MTNYFFLLFLLFLIGCKGSTGRLSRQMGESMISLGAVAKNEPKTEHKEE